MFSSCHFVVFTPTCATPFRITKVNFGTPFYITRSYISLEYVLDTFLHINAHFGHIRHSCHNLCSKCHNVSFQQSRLEIGVSWLSFHGVTNVHEYFAFRWLVLMEFMCMIHVLFVL